MLYRCPYKETLNLEDKLEDHCPSTKAGGDSKAIPVKNKISVKNSADIAS
jgi:hypothetical protein